MSTKEEEELVTPVTSIGGGIPNNSITQPLNIDMLVNQQGISNNSIAQSSINLELLINPWEVTNVTEFSYFCCPECDFKSKAVPPFIDHARYDFT